VPTRDLPLSATLDERTIDARLQIAELGGYHVAVSTVLLCPELPIELHSSYLGHPRVATSATHLAIAPGHADIDVVSHDHAQLPVTHARERCVLDHLQALVELADQLGHTLQVELLEHAATG
jgi:hypothetical protein